MKRWVLILIVMIGLSGCVIIENDRPIWARRQTFRKRTTIVMPHVIIIKKGDHYRHW